MPHSVSIIVLQSHQRLPRQQQQDRQFQQRQYQQVSRGHPFQEYRKRKEQERSSRFKSKGKQAKVETKEKDKTPSEVTINIGLRKFRDDDLKFVRGSSLALIVRSSIGAEELLKKAAEKIVKFNRELTGGVFGFTLLYPDRTKVVMLQGSSEPFTLEIFLKPMLIVTSLGVLSFSLVSTLACFPWI